MKKSEKSEKKYKKVKKSIKKYFQLFLMYLLSTEPYLGTTHSVFETLEKGAGLIEVLA